MRVRSLSIALGVVAVLGCPAAKADFVAIGSPIAPYLSTTTLVPFTSPDNTVVSSTTNGTQTLSYSAPLTEFTVPVTWNTWNTPPNVETSTPRVGGTSTATSLTINLLIPSKTFGIEIEPDLFEDEDVRVQFFAGAVLVGTIDRMVNGDSDAALFAATTSLSPFTRVTVTDLVGDDFAIAQQRYGLLTVVPEPSAFWLTAIMLVGIGAAVCSRRSPRKVV
jgi:hypothetical protein